MDGGAGVVRGAPLKGDLELPGEVLPHGVAEEVAVGGLGVGGHVKGFLGGDPGVGAAGDGPDGVAAGLPRGEAHGVHRP